MSTVTPTATVFERLNDLPADALQTLANDVRCGLYGTPDWYANLLENVNLGPGNRAAFHVVRSGNEVRLVLPLLVKPAEHLVTSLANFFSPLSAPAVHPSADRADWATLFKAVRAAYRGITEIHLGPLPQELEANDGALAQGLRDAGYRLQPYFSFGNWYLPRTMPWEAYWAQRPSTLKNTVERKGRRFAKMGGCLEVICGEPGLERGIAAFQAVYADSWKGAEPHPGFMPGLLRTAAKQGWLRLGVAWLNGDAVAVQAWFCARGKADIYKLAYRERHRDLSAGSLLSAALMQHVIAVDGVHEVDYLMGDDPYKRGWVSHRRERWSLAAYDAFSWRGNLAWLNQHLGRLFRRRREQSVRHTP